MIRTVMLASLVLATSGAMAAEIYMYRDAQGNVQYTDKPPALEAERLKVQSQPTDPQAARDRAQAEQARLSEAADQRQQQQQAAAEARAAEELNAQDRARRCVEARDRYDNYMNSRRLYELLPDGERRYLSAEELDAARASAKATMEEMCQ